MPPLEAWEKVLIDNETFTATIHGMIPCTDCHLGMQDANKEIAHTGLVAHPSETDSDGVCGDCHPSMTSTFQDSLHVNQTGYWTTFEERGVMENHPAIDEMFGNHCQSCHTSCGDCHVSQPRSVGGGFISGHTYEKTPSMTRNCTACHGSRVGNEYLGKNEDVKSDIHFRQERMTCTACHSGHEMHGQTTDCETCHTEMSATDTPPPDHRYDADDLQITCESCHPEATQGFDGIAMHAQHGSKLSCQVCHSVSYTSCDGCHVQISEETGNPFFATDAHYMTFVIGRNPIQSETRPYDFVTLRHIPVTEDSYAFYGDNLLSNFDALPTWTYSTPHNIQRIAPQAESCNACHGNEAIFLTADKVVGYELNANQSVIVDSIPAALTEE